MARFRWSFVLVVSLGIAGFACQPQAESPEAAAAPEAAPPAAAEPEAGPDATVVDPAHYTVDHESDRLRVIRIKYGPGEQSVMHYHPEGMAVFLTPGHVRFELADGTSQEMEVEAGQTVLSPAGQHKPTNLGDAAFEVIQVELKDGSGAGAADAAAGGDDATVVDAAHYTVDHESDRLRVIRINYGPGDESVMHYHAEGMAAFLTPGRVRFELPDGTTQELEVEAGQTVLSPAGQHKPTNLGDAAFEVIQVELKD